MHGLEDRFGLAPGGAASQIGGRTGLANEKLGRVHRLNCGWQARVVQDGLFWTAMARESAWGITSGSARCGPVK